MDNKKWYICLNFAEGEDVFLAPLTDDELAVLQNFLKFSRKYPICRNYGGTLHIYNEPYNTYEEAADAARTMWG